MAFIEALYDNKPNNIHLLLWYSHQHKEHIGHLCIMRNLDITYASGEMWWEAWTKRCHFGIIVNNIIESRIWRMTSLL